MPRKPSDDAARLKRIEALCKQVSTSVRTSRQQRLAALRLAEEAIKLAKADEADGRRPKKTGQP